MYETSIEKTNISLSPYKTHERELHLKKIKVRNPSVKTTKSKLSNYHKKKSIINIYPKNISFDYSNNNEYKVLNYQTDLSQNQISDNLIKEKNEIIHNLQNQINKYALKLKESLKKINIQNQIINSLNTQNRQLNNENARKNNIIRQNEDIDFKISKLRKDVEKSREKILNDDFNESKRNNYILYNKINNYAKELKEKDDEIKRIKSRNDYLIKLLKDNESKLNIKNSQLNKLKEENILSKNKLSELQNNYNNLLLQTNNLNNFQLNQGQNIINYNNINDFNDESNDEKYKILEMKIKNSQDEIRTKNININLLNRKIEFLNSILSQKNEIIQKLQKEKTNLNKTSTNITSKNLELNKILNQKHEDIIQFQKSIIEKEKKIKQLTDYITKLKSSQNNAQNISQKQSVNLISDDEKESNHIFNINKLFKINEIKYNIIQKGINNLDYIKEQRENVIKINKSNKTIEKLNNDIKVINDEFKKYKTKAELDIKNLEKKVMDEKNNYNTKIEEYLKNVKSLTDKLNKLEQEKKDNEKKINLLNIENKKLIEEKNEKEEEETLNKIELINENEKNKEEIILLKQQIETLNKKLELRNKDIKDINIDLENKIISLNEEINKYKDTISKKDISLKNIKEENDDNLLKIDELAKKINDNEINIKGINLENKELKETIDSKEKEAEKLKNEIQNLNGEIEKLKNEINNLTQMNIKKEDKIKVFDEEKNNLVNNFFEKEKEFEHNKLKITDLEQTIEKLTGEKNEINKENEILKKKNEEIINENHKLNLFLKESEDNLKITEEKYNSLKNHKSLNNKNDIENLIEKNNNIIKEKINLENEIKKLNSEHKNILEEMLLSKSELELKYSETLKENEKLQEKIKQLSILQDNLEDQLNTINIKYKENKKVLEKNEKELSDMKEASQAILMKQKTTLEKEVIVDKEKCKIIGDKIYNNLKWYLIYDLNSDEKNYENYRWVNGTVIKDDQLSKYNKYQTDSQKIKDLEDYIMTLQKKLENKEESINKLDYKNKQLIKEIHNKTAGAKTFKNPLTRAVSGNVKNTSTDIAIKNDNIFAELNKGKNNIENDEEKSVNLLSQKKVDEFLTTNAGEEEDFDEVKQITKQMNFLKKELKELKSFNQQITEQVKELIKNIKCDNKNKLQIAQICQLLNLSPTTTNRILTNNKKGIKI